MVWNCNQLKKKLNLTIEEKIIKKFKDNYVGSLSSFVEGTMIQYLKIQNIEIED